MGPSERGPPTRRADRRQWAIVKATLLACIAAGGAERAPYLLVAVAQLFPELTAAELSQALQVATAAAECQALRSH